MKIIKQIILFLIFADLLVALGACSSGNSNDSNSALLLLQASTAAATKEKTENWNYEGSTELLKNNRSKYVSPTTTALNIKIGSDVDLTTKEQAVYLVKYNSSKDDDLPKEKIRYVLNATGVVKPEFSETSRNCENNYAESVSRCRVHPSVDTTSYNSDSRADAGYASPLTLVGVYEDGNSTHTVAEATETTFYVSGDPSSSSRKVVKAKLLSKGDGVNIWSCTQYTADSIDGVAESDWQWLDDNTYGITDATKNEEARFTPADAEDYRKKFVKIRDMVRKVFNDETECDYLFDDSLTEIVHAGKGKKAMAQVSRFGNDINMLFYDMTSIEGTDIYGYFWLVDYGRNNSSDLTDFSRFSNEGKILYMNITLSKGSAAMIQDMYTTEAHEYMHMIEYNMKNVKNGVFNSDVTSEMLGMMLEDVVAESEELQINNQPVPYSARPASRFRSFNGNYTTIGICGDEEESAMHYSTSASLGCWLLRNYGGARLLRRIVNSPYVDEEAIGYALKDLYPEQFKGLNKDAFIEVMQYYFEAVTTTYYYGNYGTLNIWNDDQDEIVWNGYKFPVSPINIFDLNGNNSDGIKQSIVRDEDKEDDYNFGPRLHNAYIPLEKLEVDAFTKDSTLAKDGCLPRGYGMQICKIGRIPAGTTDIKIEFANAGADHSEMYVIIGDNRMMFKEN